MLAKILPFLALAAFAEAQWRNEMSRRFFDKSCQPQCKDGHQGAATMVSGDNECPTDFSGEKDLEGIFVSPWEWCAPEVRFAQNDLLP